MPAKWTEVLPATLRVRGRKVEYAMLSYNSGQGHVQWRRHHALVRIANECARLCGAKVVRTEQTVGQAAGNGNEMLRSDLTFESDAGHVYHIDVTVRDVTAPTYIQNGQAFQPGRVMCNAHRSKLQHYSHIFGQTGKQLNGHTLIPMAFEVTGAQGKGVDQFLSVMKKLRCDAGLQKSPYLMAFWRRRFSMALHSTLSIGARAAMIREAGKLHLPNWRRLQEVEQLYASDRMIE